MNTQHLFCALLLASGLAACGGGDGDPAPVAITEVPASAAASPAAYVGFAASLGADESGEPLGLDAIEPPVSETDEPADMS